MPRGCGRILIGQGVHVEAERVAWHEEFCTSRPLESTPVTVRLQVPVADVRDGDTILDITPRPGGNGFIPRRADTVNPLARTVQVAGTYLVDGRPAGTGGWTWATDATATIERETTP